MPISERWRRLKPRLAVESLVVVFSILLALVVNGGMAGMLNSMSAWEAQLLREYERALGALGVPEDSLAGAG